MAMETQYGGLGHWIVRDYGHVNVPQRSNTRNYHVVTVNKMAVSSHARISSWFLVVLVFVSILSQYGMSHYS